MNEDIRQEQDKELLDFVTSKLEYNFIKDMLVKPLEDIKVIKEITEMVPKEDGEMSGGFPVMEPKTETKEVESFFKTGIVLAIPSNYAWADPNNHPEVGDIVAYARKGIIDFDLFKDSQVVNPYNVVAFIKKS